MKIVVFAGNWAQVKEWCDRRNVPTSSVIFPTDEIQLRGLSEVPVLRLGNWRDNPVFQSSAAKALER